MLNKLTAFFDHTRHKLSVADLEATLDVLTFEGEESLSQPFKYTVEFTCVEQDIAAEQILGQYATFSLHAAPYKAPLKYTYSSEEAAKEKLKLTQRTLYGVITGFKRLSSSNDEARYEITLQPRLALLDKGRQYRIYQHQSVPEIVESIFRNRHGFLGQDFYFKLAREYPKRVQVMQYGESDLAFISRLLAEVGIWYHFSSDERLKIGVVELRDDQRHYQFDVQLPLREQSGFTSNGEDSVWLLQTSHAVVEKNINFRAYYHRDANAWLNGEVDQTRGDKTTYGEAYHYAEPYTVLGDSLAHDEDLESESGFFYARLRHERYLNDQTRLAGVSSSATLGLGQVLNISGGAPQAFKPGAVLTRLITRAARDRSLETLFEAIPYSETVCFRPPQPDKPQIAGTVPARVTSPKLGDIYAEVDLEGRYRVNFLFDRDEWKTGHESMWLRLARPYSGDKHGLHLPLIAGTEVAIAFEQGDPDRPYIAHALHDDRRPDHVTLDKRDYTRNVLRTPSNNKLRMEDLRGSEHIKLSTEHSGKSQLNLGHLVDAKKQKRGEGFELRTDGWGAIRGGKGVFISADDQTKAQGDQLDMAAAIQQLESALSLARSLAQAAQSAETKPSDIDSQVRLNQALKGLSQSGLLLHAPAGIGLVSSEAICLSSGAESVGLMSAHNTDISAGRDITATAEGAVSALARTGDMQLKAAQGKVEFHAQGSSLHAMAKTNIKIESVEGRVEITAPDELVLNCGGAYIRLKGGEIEIGAPGNIHLKAANVLKGTEASLNTPASPLPSGYAGAYTLKDEAQAPLPFNNYRITTPQGEVFNGVTDKDGKTMNINTPLPGALMVEFPDKTPAFGAGQWVTIDDDYHGLKNTAILALNRLTSMGDEGRLLGSSGKDYQNTKRDKVQQWQPLPEDAEEHLVAESAVHKYGATRRIPQTYLEGNDAWAVSGNSWHWQPVTADVVYEKKVSQ